MVPGVCIPFGPFAIGALRASSEQRCCATFAILGYYELNGFADVARRLNTIVCGRILLVLKGQEIVRLCGQSGSPKKEAMVGTQWSNQHMQMSSNELKPSSHL